MAEQKKRKKSTRRKTILSPQSGVRTLALKFYAEQVPGWQNPQSLAAPILCGNINAQTMEQNHNLAELARKVLVEKVAAIDKSEMQVIGIMHDRDLVTDEKNFWEPATEKPHFHIIVRIMDGKVMRVSTILNKLGVEYRRETDDILWTKNGVETVRDFSSYAMYLTHETEQAKLDGKELYGLDELFSNLTLDEIKEVRNGYIDPSRIKVKVEDMAELDKTAYQRGYEFKDFNKWCGDLPYEVRKNAGMRTVEQSYYRGIDDRVAEGGTIIRLCVFIFGEHDTGKSYAAEHALCGAGKNVLPVRGGGTGKFDNLRPDHDAIVIDDETCPNLLNMSDNRICRAYKRQKNNPAWTGKYLVVTSNKDFDTWLMECHISAENQKAAWSRFYVCHVERGSDGRKRLVLDHASRRGTMAEQKERLGMFQDFRDRFDVFVRTYEPEKGCVIDYDYLEEKYFKANQEEQRIIHGLYIELQRCLRSMGFSSRVVREKSCVLKYAQPLAGDPLYGCAISPWEMIRRQYEEELKGAYCRNDHIDINYVTGQFEALQAEYEEVVNMIPELKKELGI